MIMKRSDNSNLFFLALALPPNSVQIASDFLPSTKKIVLLFPPLCHFLFHDFRSNFQRMSQKTVSLFTRNHSGEWQWLTWLLCTQIRASKAFQTLLIRYPHVVRNRGLVVFLFFTPMKSVFASACEGESEKITNNKGRLSKRLSALFSETILFSSEIIRGPGTKN